MTADIAFTLGEGTGNDFVIVPDLDASLDLSPALIAAICHRRTGIGADGTLRVVRSADHPEAIAQTGDAEFFMDYHNADGSSAAMCGNGIRVFARYLVDSGLAPAGELTIATRGGPRTVRVPDDPHGDIRVDMGSATTPRLRAMPYVTVGECRWPAVGVLVPNPHAVVFVSDLADAGTLHDAPAVDPGAVFPDGVNVEFVVDRGENHVAMRVHERGSGETMSCGTGAVAVAWARRRRHLGEPGGPGGLSGDTLRVDVPGGTLHVTETTGGTLFLTGPARLIADGALRASWLAAHL